MQLYAGSEPGRIPIYDRLLSALDSDFVCCINAYDIYIGKRRLCSTNARIIALGISRVFRVVVFSTADGCVHFRSARKGKLLTIPVLLPDVVTRILVTDIWGFVLMQSANSLFFFTVNGLRIREIRLQVPIVTWSTFPVDGFDWVAYADENGRAGVFEAFSECLALPVHLDLNGADVISASVDLEISRFIVITRDGLIAAIPYSVGDPEPQAALELQWWMDPRLVFPGEKKGISAKFM
jgi:hypothetical protein